MNIFQRDRCPRVVKVLGHKITVRTVRHLVDSEEDLLGAWNSETKTIFLKSGCDWRSVLFHEMLHAALYLSGASEGLSISKEESIVLALEHAIVPHIHNR